MLLYLIQANHSWFALGIGRIVHLENTITVNYTPAARSLNVDDR